MDAPIHQTESPYELGRKLENAIRRGTVAEINLRTARVRVTTGGNTTDWLPWLALRAGGIEKGRHWHAPVLGEQVVVLSQVGDLAQGVVLLGLYSDDMPQGSDIAGHERMDWDEFNYWEWLHGACNMYCTKSITLHVGDSCRLRMTPEQVQINVGSASLTMSEARITSNVDIVAQGISLKAHRHEDVRSGPDTTGGPI